MYLVFTRDPEVMRPTVTKREGTPTLDDFYREIDCRTVDRVTIHHDPDTGRNLDAWVDDEGLLQRPPRSPVVWFDELDTYRGVVHLAGPVLVAASDRAGETVPMTEEEIESLQPTRKLAMVPGLAGLVPVWTVRKTELPPGPLRHPVVNCPHCDHKLYAMWTSGEREPGDVTVCLHCARILIIQEGYKLRAPTTEERGELMKHDNVRKIVSLVKQYTPRGPR